MGADKSIFTKLSKIHDILRNAIEQLLPWADRFDFHSRPIHQLNHGKVAAHGTGSDLSDSALLDEPVQQGIPSVLPNPGSPYRAMSDQDTDIDRLVMRRRIRCHCSNGDVVDHPSYAKKQVRTAGEAIEVAAARCRRMSDKALIAIFDDLWVVQPADIFGVDVGCREWAQHHQRSRQYIELVDHWAQVKEIGLAQASQIVPDLVKRMDNQLYVVES